MANILDLSNLNSQTATFNVSREAAFDNTVDFYQVNADGSVIDSEGNTIAPGEEGYTEAAIANRLELNLSAVNGETETFTEKLAGGALYAPIIAVDSDFSSFGDGDSSNDPNVYFTYEAANIDGFDHVDSSEENRFSFEDLFNGGDRDFDDIVVDVELNDSGSTPPPPPNIEGENLVIDDAGVVGSVDLSTGEFTEIFDTDISLTDIDIAPDNSVFAVSFSDLYSIDLETNTATLIGEHDINGLNALEIAEDGTLFAAASSQEIYTLDPTTGTSTAIGSVPFDFSSAGDLQFIENTLYATDNQALVALDVEGNVLNEATSIGSLGLDDEFVFGITIDEDGDPVGLTDNGRILSLNLATGNATSIGTVENNRPIFGAAAVPEGFFDEDTTQPSNGTISGVKFSDRNNNGERDNIVEGENPDVVFVVDASPSAVFPFVGDALQDVNNDADASAEVVRRYLNDEIQNVTEEDKNTLINASPNNPNILDAQLSAFIALNQQLETQELGDDTDVGIVVFSGNAALVDLDPSTAGFQLTTTPNADSNNNGTSDIEEVLRSITFESVVDSSGTNFEAALQEAENVFNSLATEPEDGNLVFLSDGFPAESGSYVDEVARLNDLEVNVTAFGVGESASLEDLQNIDSGAEIFTSINEVTDIFGELNSGNNEETGGGELENQLEPGVPGVNIYLDLNDNGVLDDGEPFQETDENGQYVFEGLAAGTYTVREVVPDGFIQTAPDSGEYTFTLGEGEIVENIDFGNFEEVAMMEVESTEI